MSRPGPHHIGTKGAVDNQGLVYDKATDEFKPKTVVRSVVAGTNVTVDNTDPANPIVAASGGGGGSLTVQDENSNVATGVTQIDFQGAGVTATAGTGEVVVTIPGGGGGAWDHPTSLPLSTLTGWTVGSGTWSIIGGVINQSSTAASQRRLHLNAVPPLAHIVGQVDIKVNTLGATTTARAGIMFGTPATSDGGNSDLFYLASNGSTAQVAILSSERDGTAAYATVNLAAPIANGTWTTLRVYKSGRDFTIWINGTLLTTIQASAAGTAMGRFALYTYQADASFRNLDLWTPTMP